MADFNQNFNTNSGAGDFERFNSDGTRKKGKGEKNKKEQEPAFCWRSLP